MEGSRCSGYQLRRCVIRNEATCLLTSGEDVTAYSKPTREELEFDGRALSVTIEKMIKNMRGKSSTSSTHHHVVPLINCNSSKGVVWGFH
jgi:hypothetical protein